mmetsp:Transcript_50145/g.112760  ORF Transcript_50145/g.112760 Transcript_50145/m.112760 type:complete len:284 (-) Transcript_50145:90-941(-)
MAAAPGLGVARAGKLQDLFNPLVPSSLDHPHSQAEQVGRLFHLFERDIETLDSQLGGSCLVRKQALPRWARSPESCAMKAAEVIDFYQQQINALEARLAERRELGVPSSGTSVLGSETSPERCAGRLLGLRCLPGFSIPSGSDTSPKTRSAVAAVEWMGDATGVRAMRLRFASEDLTEESTEWQRMELLEGEHLRGLRGRGAAPLWAMVVTSFGRTVTMGGPVDDPIPTFSFFAQEGHEICGISMGPGGEVQGVDQRTFSRCRRMTKIRRRSRPPRRLPGESV